MSGRDGKAVAAVSDRRRRSEIDVTEALEIDATEAAAGLSRTSTASRPVRNKVYPRPRERKFTVGSVCPRFASKLNGSVAYAWAHWVVERGLVVGKPAPPSFKSTAAPMKTAMNSKQQGRRRPLFITLWFAPAALLAMPILPLTTFLLGNDPRFEILTPTFDFCVLPFDLLFLPLVYDGDRRYRLILYELGSTERLIVVVRVTLLVVPFPLGTGRVPVSKTFTVPEGVPLTTGLMLIGFT